MKKLIIFVLIFSLAPFFLYSKKVQAETWNDCLYEKVNDEYPGDCSRYIDTDNDGICDHSQPPPAERDEQIENNELAPAIVQLAVKDKEQKPVQKPNYNISLIFFLVFGFYGLTYILSKKKKISTLTNKKIWNILLTLTFLFNTITSLLFLIQLSYNLNLNLPFNLSFWHIESGIVFIFIAVFHIFWHISYYRQIIKK